MRATDAPGGGHVLAGALKRAGSPAELLRSGLAVARSAFGPTDVLGATRSTDGTLTVALFRARSGGVPIAGMVLATYAAHDSRVAIVYDRADRFATTAPALIARATTPQAGTSAYAGALRDVVSPDGSVHAKVPPEWKISTFAQGQFSAIGPDGAEVDQEVSARLIDPRSPVFQQALALQAQMRRPVNAFATPYGIPLTYVADPARAFVSFANTIARAQHMADPAITIERTSPQPGQPGLHAAEIVGTETIKGTRTRFDGIVGIGEPNSNGAWMISLKMISAPLAHFDAALPQLAAVYNSYRVDQGVRGNQVAQTQAEDRAGAARGLALMQQTQSKNAAVFNASMSHARSVQDSIDRSTAGFSHYLSDTTVLQGPGGARGVADRTFADAVVNNDPNFRIVPVSEYRKGTDF